MLQRRDCSRGNFFAAFLHEMSGINDSSGSGQPRISRRSACMTGGPRTGSVMPIARRTPAPGWENGGRPLYTERPDKARRKRRPPKATDVGTSLTSENVALVLIDHEVSGLISGVRDYSIAELKHNVVGLAKAAMALKLPIVVTTTARDSMWGPTFS